MSVRLGEIARQKEQDETKAWRTLHFRRSTHSLVSGILASYLVAVRIVFQPHRLAAFTEVRTAGRGMSRSGREQQAASFLLPVSHAAHHRTVRALCTSQYLSCIRPKLVYLLLVPVNGAIDTAVSRFCSQYQCVSRQGLMYKTAL